nr:BPI fold-containing family B member 4-like isoform X2 [Columba livia]
MLDLDGLLGGGGLLGGELLGGGGLLGGGLLSNGIPHKSTHLAWIFHFLSGSSAETNITSHIALTQDTPGDLKFMVKDCSNLLGGFRVNLRPGLFTNLVSRLLNSSLQTLVPALLCPLVNIWVSIINIKLQFLNRLIPFGLLGKIHSALSSLPLTSGQYVELDLQRSPFPGAFIDWLLQIAGVDPGSAE